ncbi:peptidoglycan editing factor PgeF [Alteromonas portus]|uniref:Purine nucleoside phosphorylase n=1 Tax=Alteromonas portus TaxID=2565549 RepID=A0A4U0ZHN8_9ALTE|nr:peptidoglycan editing factor PgeF [Alteromonas portus]TKB02993.1 peptidoglycan editing factor PgeF [Alteromonas portus]
MTWSAANSPLSSTLDLITPAWSCPSNIVAYTTTRKGGTSLGDFAGLNVGAHVGDDLLLVKANRSAIPHSNKITWLEQVHSNRVVSLPSADTTADAAHSSSVSHFCAIMTADCVPILLCDESGQEVAAVHAGWKGLDTNIIANTVRHFSCDANKLIAWIGPAISGSCYEVDAQLASKFRHVKGAIANSYNKGKYLLDLPLIAQMQLQQAGVNSITQSNLCTYTDEQRFYSHRRATHQNKRTTGRMVSVIGLL